MPDPDPSSIIFKLLILLVLVLVNAFFSMSEMAIITLNDNKVRKLAQEGHKGALKVLKLTENPSSFLSTIQVGVTLAGFLTSASAAGNFSQPLTNLFIGTFNIFSDSMVSFVSGLSTIIVTIIMAYFSLVLGELVPKRIAMQRSEEISYKVVGVLLSVRRTLTLFIKLLSWSTNIIVKLMGFDPNVSQEEVTEEEIRMMVDAGQEKGTIEESEKEMINNVFEFDNIIASDVMTHRTDFIAVEISDSIAEAIELIIHEGYSRIPVYEEELDDIRGILYVKDLLKYVSEGIPDNLKLSDVMRKAFFVPDSKRCRDLFDEMTAKHLQMVIVADEYGGVDGLVTIEDLLESIVGNMQDEYDNEDEDMEQLNETTFTIEGTTDIEEVEDLLATKFPEGEYDTIGGFVMSVIGRIPLPDENPSVEFGGYLFTVEKMEERRIEHIRAEKIHAHEIEQDEQ